MMAGPQYPPQAQQQDPYAHFQDAPDQQQAAPQGAPQADPYGHFQDAPPVRQDQVLGFEQGFLSPLARTQAGIEKGLEAIGYPARALNEHLTIGGQSAMANENA